MDVHYGTKPTRNYCVQTLLFSRCRRRLSFLCYNDVMEEREHGGTIERLRTYFAGREDVLLAFLFGSQTTGMIHAHSDWDIAVYFKPSTGVLEYQSDQYYDSESDLQLDLARITGSDVDLVVVNHAPATIVFSALRGIILTQKDYWSYSVLLAKSLFDALDYRRIVADYSAISLRSQSLNPIDKDRLTRIVTFLATELTDLGRLRGMGQLVYQQDRDMQRSLDRCVENVMNATIDSAKTLLGSEHVALPETYKEMILGLRLLKDFSEQHASILSKGADMRNLLAHEYLDLRFRGISVFIERALPSLKYLEVFLRELLVQANTDTSN